MVLDVLDDLVECRFDIVKSLLVGWREGRIDALERHVAAVSGLHTLNCGQCSPVSVVCTSSQFPAKPQRQRVCRVVTGQSEQG